MFNAPTQFACALCVAMYIYIHMHIHSFNLDFNDYETWLLVPSINANHSRFELKSSTHHKKYSYIVRFYEE